MFVQVKLLQFRSIYISEFLSSCLLLTSLPSIKSGHNSWTEEGWSVWKVLTYGSASCCEWQHPQWKYDCIYRVHDQCQYGCWYRWEQQPATIEWHLCGQTASSYSHSTLHDQCQYGCWYRWEQQPSTIEQHLCDQTNLIMVQSLNDKVEVYMSYCHRLLTCGCCVCACRYVIVSPGCCQGM